MPENSLLRKILIIFHPDVLPEGERRDDDRRREDQWRRRLTRAWRVIEVAVWVWIVATMFHQINTVKDNRVEGTNQRCELAKATIDTAVDLGADPDRLGKLRTNLAECRRLESEIREGKK